MNKSTKNIGSHYIKMWEEKVQRSKGTISYCEDALSHELQEWERKEYQSILDKAYVELNQNEQQLETVKGMYK